MDAADEKGETPQISEDTAHQIGVGTYYYAILSLHGERPPPAASFHKTSQQQTLLMIRVRGPYLQGNPSSPIHCMLCSSMDEISSAT
jgi:hypothetical protein